MVRPRLVEEGLPITQAADNEYDDNRNGTNAIDDIVIDQYDDNNSYSNNADGGSLNASLSSLQMAAKRIESVTNRQQQKQQHRSSHTIIGSTNTATMRSGSDDADAALIISNDFHDNHNNNNVNVNHLQQLQQQQQYQQHQQVQYPSSLQHPQQQQQYHSVPVVDNFSIQQQPDRVHPNYNYQDTLQRNPNSTIYDTTSATSAPMIREYIFRADESIRSLTNSSLVLATLANYNDDSFATPTTAPKTNSITPYTTSNSSCSHNKIISTKTHIEIGAMDDVTFVDTNDDESNHHNDNYTLRSPIERMVGVEDHGYKAPLVVLDGANIAYAYSKIMSSSMKTTTTTSGTRIEPNVRGIYVACQYFERAGLRVLVVLQQSYYTRVQQITMMNHHNNDNSTGNYNETEQQWITVIQKYLYERGMLVLAPSRDDDDAYCLYVAQRENYRARSRLIHHDHHHQHGNQKHHHQIQQPYNSYGDDGRGWAYIVSNDLFRDAQERDNQMNNNKKNDPVTKGGTLHQYLNVDVRGHCIDTDNSPTVHNSESLSSPSSSLVYGPGRISYTFVDMGKLDDHGDHELDFIPNPRHPLIQWIDEFSQL